MRTKILHRAFSLLAIIAFLSFIIYSCTEPLNNTNSNNNNNTGQTGSVTGKVVTTNNAGVIGAEIRVGNAVTYSNEWGDYILIGVPVGTHVVISFKLANYASTFKVVAVKANKNSYIDAALLPIGKSLQVNATTGGSVAFGGASVNLPANGIVDSKGNAFKGNVTVQATYFDPTNALFFGCFPGEFKGTRTDNSETMIESFGYVSVELYNGTEKMQLAQGSQAKIIIPIPAMLQAKAPQSIILWYFDETQGKWMEQGTAVKSGNNYEGNVSHFTDWNADMTTLSSYLSGKVVDGNGNPISCVAIYGQGADYTGASNVSTSDDGSFLLPVKANSNVSVFAKYYTYTSPATNYGTPDVGQTTNIGNIVLNVDTMNCVIITGRLIDNGNNPLPGVYLKLFDSTLKLVYLLYNTSNDGKFKLFGHINNKYYVQQVNYWFDTTKPRQSFPVTTGSQNGLLDMGDLRVDVGGATIVGKVVDASNNPLANISIYSSEGAYAFWGMKDKSTDANGSFMLWCRPSVTVTIKLTDANSNVKYITPSPTSPALGGTLDLGNITFP
ncbi:MAG: carboxypeptidase-like regulatory domain-containing protein [FCB group bacterium]|jgi:protocatechuate 3,4-dioxygenase beta subunit